MVTNFYKTKWIEPKRIGPFRVEKVMENNNYLIYDHFRNNWKKYNIENLTKYFFDEGSWNNEEKEENEKLNPKSPKVEQEREREVGSRVRVWFDDKQKNFKGTIRSRVEEDKFEIDWEDKKQEREVVELRKENMTKRKENLERWSFIKRT